MMRFFTGQVHGGRLILDEPIDLPDGTLFELVSTEDVLNNGGNLLDAERAELDRELDESFAETNAGGMDAGELIDITDAVADLRAWR